MKGKGKDLDQVLDQAISQIGQTEPDPQFEKAAGDRVWQRVVKVAGGMLTACEVLNEQQLSVSRFGPSV